MAKWINSSSAAKVEKLDEDGIRQLAFQATGNVCPMQAVIGAIAAQEVMKVYNLSVSIYLQCIHGWGTGGRFKNTYELLNLRALKFSYVNKIHIFQCMGKIFCVKRYPLKFHTKYLTHTLKDMIFMQFWNFKSS